MPKGKGKKAMSGIIDKLLSQPNSATQPETRADGDGDGGISANTWIAVESQDMLDTLVAALKLSGAKLDDKREAVNDPADDNILAYLTAGGWEGDEYPIDQPACRKFLKLDT
jgi:hypothetical protein